MGVEPTADGRTVWAVLPLEDPLPAGDDVEGGQEPVPATATSGAGAVRPARASGVTASMLRPVRLLQLPVQVWAAAQQHHDELLREFALMTAGLEDRVGGSPPVPVRLCACSSSSPPASAAPQPSGTPGCSPPPRG